MRCALYARVSTARQAEHNISIPDQLAQARRFADARGWIVSGEFVELGASARDDKRPQFQALIDAACTDPTPFDFILVHSFSRFFRDEVQFELYRRRLEKHGVRIESITQELGEGPGGTLTRRIMTLMDEMQSEENAKHVRRSMAENARQGFWNGSMPPLGYVAEAAEKRGTKIKKRLAIDPQSAEIVKLIFRLFLEGDGTRGSLGVKHIAAWLNAHGYRSTTGKLFYTSRVHTILTDETYVGRAYFNRMDSRSRKQRSRDQWIAVSVPSIIPEEPFQRAQLLLRDRRSDRTPPRIANSEVLLTGIALCEACGKPLMMTTGKGGAYRYYKCSGRHLRGACEGGRPTIIPEGTLDRLTLDALTSQLLTPERTQAIVAEVAKRRASGRKEALHGLAQLRGQLSQVNRRLRNLLDAVADGLAGDTTIFREKTKELESERESLLRLIALQEGAADAALKPISRNQAVIAAERLKERLANAPAGLKKRYVRAFVSEIVVGPKEIIISGPESALAEAMTGKLSALAAQAPVRSLVREWRTREDSNL